jgi:hypothetical protein
LITLAATKRKRRYHFLLPEICINEATNLSLGLTRAQFRIGQLTRANPLRETLLERALLVDYGFPNLLH